MEEHAGGDDELMKSRRAKPGRGSRAEQRRQRVSAPLCGRLQRAANVARRPASPAATLRRGRGERPEHEQKAQKAAGSSAMPKDLATSSSAVRHSSGSRPAQRPIVRPVPRWLRKADDKAPPAIPVFFPPSRAASYLPSKVDPQTAQTISAAALAGIS